jgi:hypothetical protein
MVSECRAAVSCSRLVDFSDVQGSRRQKQGACRGSYANRRPTTPRHEQLRTICLRFVCVVCKYSLEMCCQYKTWFGSENKGLSSDLRKGTLAIAASTHAVMPAQQIDF